MTATTQAVAWLSAEKWAELEANPAVTIAAGGSWLDAEAPEVLQ